MKTPLAILKKSLYVQGNSRHDQQVCLIGLLINFDLFFLKVKLMASTTKIPAPLSK